jgi:hypothetical protein
MNIEDKILQKIKEENLKPKSVWYFLARDYSLWSLVLVSILLAAFCFAPLLFIFQNFEFGFIKHLTGNFYTFILWALPYPWIILCGTTTYFAKKAWENTKNGYKFDGRYIVLYSFFISLALGAGLNQYNLGRMIDEGVQSGGLPFYKSMEARRQENWFDPDNGRFIGVVKNVSTTSFTLNNEKNSFSETIIFDEDVPGIEFIDSSNTIRVIGYREATDTSFFACAIFPDDFLPFKERKGMRNKIRDNFEDHPECKEMFDKGRAYFSPSPRHLAPPRN